MLRLRWLASLITLLVLAGIWRNGLTWWTVIASNVTAAGFGWDLRDNWLAMRAYLPTWKRKTKSCPTSGT